MKLCDCFGSQIHQAVALDDSPDDEAGGVTNVTPAHGLEVKSVPSTSIDVPMAAIYQ